MTPISTAVAFARRLARRLNSSPTLPIPGTQALPDRLVGLTGIKSWPLASLVYGVGLYALYLLVNLARGDLDPLFGPEHWWFYGMLPGVIVAYLLLIRPLLRQLAMRTVADSRPLLPASIDVGSLTLRAIRVHAGHEWLAVLGGLVVNWALVQPWRLTQEGLLLVGYNTLAQGLMYALIGSTLYTTLRTTRFLTKLYDKMQVSALYGVGIRNPLNQWSLGGASLLVVGIVLAGLFTQPKYLLRPEPLIVNGLVLLAVVFILMRSSMSLVVLARYRIIRALLLFFGAILLGTLGYHRLEGWSLLDGLFMSVITMTTIGFSEVHPLDPSGKIFTIFLGLVSVGIAGYAVSAAAAFIIGGDMQRILRGHRMDKEISRLQGHVVVCGAGRVGTQVVAELLKDQVPFVVIDWSQSVIDDLQQMGEILYVVDDATRDRTLRLAGVDRARGLILALSDDKDSAFVVLSARSLNPKLQVVARLVEEENADKLTRVGADQVVLPDVIGGQRLESLLTRPATVNLLDQMLDASGGAPRMEELQVEEGAALAGKTLAELELEHRFGLQVVAVRPAEGDYRFSPPPDTQLQVGGILIVYGTPVQLTALKLL